MTIQAGEPVLPMGQTAFFHEYTGLTQLTNTFYETGSPEVSVYFVAPASGNGGGALLRPDGEARGTSEPDRTLVRSVTIYRR